MNPASVSRTILRARAIFVALVVIVWHAAAISANYQSTSTQADYVIICPPAYVQTIQPLADYRSVHNGFRVRIEQTDSIYAQFGQGTSPDSAIKRFIRNALTTWQDPKPQYFLLAGNVNSVPSHKENGIVAPPLIYEDSIMVDDWFVEGLGDTLSYPGPAAAIGRFPAWNVADLGTMVNKTVTYEERVDTIGRRIAIAVADYFPQVDSAFEQAAARRQFLASPLWPDTLTGHVRPTSPRHRDRSQFRSLWGGGAALLRFVGMNNWYQFSHSRYFTTWDTDSLPPTSFLPFCTFQGDQRFEKVDTIAIAV
ncbi:MAG: hypothetical protein HY961_19005, partial [Ignavibacteriae bacterium]|nr:hypothetical protein [Ignavibacteriota bacterium]